MSTNINDLIWNEPPGEDTRINLWVSGSSTLMYIHQENCGENQGTQRAVVEGTLQELQQHFAEKTGALDACYSCFHSMWVPAMMLIKRIAPEKGTTTGRAADAVDEVTSMLRQTLTLKAEQHPYWRQWVKWGFGLDFETLQEQGRQHYNWDEREPKIFSFGNGINLGGESLVCACGPHALVGRGEKATVCGVIPASLHKKHLVGSAKPIGLAVDDMSETQLKLLVSLYEERWDPSLVAVRKWLGDHPNTSGDPRSGGVRIARQTELLSELLETTRLCLA